MSRQFEWDKAKAELNRQKHGVEFDEAGTIFVDEFSVVIPDPDHSEEEDRMIIIGMSRKNRLLVAVFTKRGSKVRLISARKATRPERKIYEEDFN
jgi:uncharacterized DUF497 family protein